jgi:acyl-CoA reductase-like NAD-dependent aldehyde dehydrogenase
MSATSLTRRQNCGYVFKGNARVSVIATVNDPVYGVAAAPFICDATRALKFADRVDSDQVATDVATSDWDVHLPGGGLRKSGSTAQERLGGSASYIATIPVSIGC